MREILFRGKRLDNGDWVEGHYHYANWYLPPSMEIVDRTYYILQIGRGDADEIDPETLGQFTGLNDKNGKKIFEGDIVRSHGGIPWLIAFEKNAFVCKDNFMRTYFALWEQWEYNWKSKEDISPSPNFEVIGNIYDNPELLN